jgi:hypothetical protein
MLQPFPFLYMVSYITHIEKTNKKLRAAQRRCALTLIPLHLFMFDRTARYRLLLVFIRQYPSRLAFIEQKIREIVDAWQKKLAS